MFVSSYVRIVRETEHETRNTKHDLIFVFMAGIIGTKIEMTRIIHNGAFTPVTLIKVPTLEVAQVKTSETDGYEAVVIRMIDGKKVTLREVSRDGVWATLEKGQEVSLDLLEGVTEVTVSSISKGKGFQGAMKRWNFSGGPASHGSKFHRALGSIGKRKPRRTKPGQKMH